MVEGYTLVDYRIDLHRLRQMVGICITPDLARGFMKDCDSRIGPQP